MKKYLFVFTILLALGFISNTVSAQLVASGINVVNGSNCALTGYPTGADLNCNTYCTLAPVAINPNSHVTIPFPCPDIDALSNGYFTIFGVRDNATGLGVKVGNGCGANLSGTFIDCQGVTRTVTFTAPNTVTIQ